MLQNAYFLAKIGADTAENEQHFAEILPTDALWLWLSLCGLRVQLARPLPRPAIEAQKAGVVLCFRDWEGVAFEFQMLQIKRLFQNLYNQ